jgi:predicted DNA binding CopG/RHH family protein
MRNIHYKRKTIRVSEAVWKELKEKRRASGVSWNLYIRDLINGNETVREVSRKPVET